MLAKRYAEHGDREAAHKLVTSHLRLVAKIAMGYRGYGLPIGEVISEGNVGLMQAVKRFDAGARLPARDLRHVVDQGGDPGIHPALLEPGEDGDDRQPEAAVLQPPQGEEPDPGARRGRPPARPGDADRREAERQRGGGRLDEPPPLRRRFAERADPRRGGRFRRVAGLARRRFGDARRRCSPSRTSSTSAAPC